MTKDPSNKPKFDAEMLIVADREIGQETPLLVSIIDGEKENKSIIGPAILEFLSLLEEIRTIAEGKDRSDQSKSLAAEKISQANSWLSVFHEQRVISKKLLEVLVDGKVKVGLWIDSEGGEVGEEDKVNYALDYLDRKESIVNSYVTVKAASAAFDLAFLSDQLSCLTKSIFMWHFSESELFPREEKVLQIRGQSDLDQETEEEMEDLIAILSNAKPEFRESLIDDVTRQIANPQNPTGSVYLEGARLHEVGLVKNCYEDIDGLIEQSRSDFPLHANHAVAFFNEAIARKVHQQIQHLPDWWTPEAIDLTGLMQKKYEKK